MYRENIRESGNGIIGGGQLKLSLSCSQDLFASYPVRVVQEKKQRVRGVRAICLAFMTPVAPGLWKIARGIGPSFGWSSIIFTRPSRLDA